MRRITHHQRGSAMIAAYYWWDGIAYSRAAARVRYAIRMHSPPSRVGVSGRA